MKKRSTRQLRKGDLLVFELVAGSLRVLDSSGVFLTDSKISVAVFALVQPERRRVAARLLAKMVAETHGLTVKECRGHEEDMVYAELE